MNKSVQMKLSFLTTSEGGCVPLQNSSRNNRSSTRSNVPGAVHSIFEFSFFIVSPTASISDIIESSLKTHASFFHFPITGIILKKIFRADIKWRVKE